jgi:hypothetical protein
LSRLNGFLLAALPAAPLVLVFQGCGFYGTPLPPAPPATSVIFCDIEDFSRCATAAEAGTETQPGTGIDSHLAFPSGFWIGRSNPIGLTPDAAGCPETGKRARVYKDAFPNGTAFCVDPGASYPTTDDACKASCRSQGWRDGDGNPYNCEYIAWRSTGVPEAGSFPNACNDAGMLLTGFLDPRKPRRVIWTERVGVTNDADLTKEGTNPDPQLGMWGDAGAVSDRRLTSGDGVVLVTASEVITFRVFGLGYDAGEPTDNITDVDYGLLMTNEVHPMDPDPQNPTVFRLLAFEPSGPELGRPVGGYRTGDDLAVAVFNGRVTYWRNGTLIYTSAVAPTHSPAHPLRAEAALFSQTATLKNARASF